jgi:uncharacterized protein (DUF1800 family)
MSRLSQDGPWNAYTPSAQAPWDLRRVVHLHRRAGFAATWGELQRDLADGPGPSIDRLLAGTSRRQGVPEDFEHLAGLLAESAVAARDPARLKAWWVYRMLFGPDPLGERLTLLWHNHFATSNAKVNDLAAMHRQNELFRELARAPFGALLRRAVRDPALLVWLDAPANRKEHPNENLARELMELFTLGLGPYTEADVKEAARALTGWTVADGRFREDATRHDAGEKTVLGRTGRWRGDDLVALLLEHPATARRLAARICGWLLAEKAVSAGQIDALAAGLREHDLDVGWAVATVLRSRAFFAEANLGACVLGPVEYTVGVVRALEMFERPPSTLLLADWAARMGQDLFYPPNVGGWPGGRGWVTTQSLIGRANFAAALIAGRSAGRSSPYQATALPRKYGWATDADSVLTFHHRLLFGTDPTPELRRRASGADGGKMMVLLLSSPEAQLG